MTASPQGISSGFFPRSCFSFPFCPKLGEVSARVTGSPRPCFLRKVLHGRRLRCCPSVPVTQGDAAVPTPQVVPGKRFLAASSADSRSCSWHCCTARQLCPGSCREPAWPQATGGASSVSGCIVDTSLCLSPCRSQPTPRGGTSAAGHAPSPSPVHRSGPGGASRPRAVGSRKSQDLDRRCRIWPAARPGLAKGCHAWCRRQNQEHQLGFPEPAAAGKCSQQPQAALAGEPSLSSPAVL